MIKIYRMIVRRRAKRSRLRSEAFAHGTQFGRSVMADCFRVVLSDPEVMGKDTFGAARRERVVNAAYGHYDAIHKKRAEEVTHEQQR